MPDTRKLARRAAKSAAVLAAAAAAAACVWTAATVAWPEHRVAAPAVVVVPSESSQLRVCPGPLLELAVDAADAGAASPIGRASVTYSAVPDSVAIETAVLAPDAGDGADGPLALSTPRGAVDPGLLAGSQWQETSTATVQGLAAAGCGEAVDESWLVGGSTLVGRTTLVLLANPGLVPSTVTLEVFGEDGRIDAPAASGIIVPAGSQRVVPLAGLAPDEGSPVVHVLADRAPIAASLEQSVIRGLAPGGVDLVGTAAQPSLRQVIPGFAVGTAGGVDPGADHAEGDEYPAIRLFAPGEGEARATVRVLDAGGAVVSTFEAGLHGGRSTDVPLGVLPAGVFTVVVDAESPVLAAARADSISGGDRDFEWAQAAAPLGERQLVAVSGAPSPVLVVHNPGTGERLVDVAVDGGAATELRIAAGATANLTVDAGASILLEGVDGLHAAVVHRAAGRIAVVPVQPPGPLDSAVRIFTR